MLHRATRKSQNSKFFPWPERIFDTNTRAAKRRAQYSWPLRTSCWSQLKWDMTANSHFHTISSMGGRKMNKRLLIWGGLSGTMETVFMNTHLDTHKKNMRTVAAGLLLWPSWKMVLTAKPQECHKILIEIQHLQENLVVSDVVLAFYFENLFWCQKLSYFSINSGIEVAKWKISMAVWFSAFLVGSRPPLWHAFSTPCCTQAWLNQRQARKSAIPFQCGK